MNGRYNVSYNDINELAYPVLRHRMKLTFEAVAERVSPDDIVKMIIDELTKKGKLENEGASVVQEHPATECESVVENDGEKNAKKRGMFRR